MGDPYRPTAPPHGWQMPAAVMEGPAQKRPLTTDVGVPPPNWWLRHTSSGWDRPYSGTLSERERDRRSRLVSWLILGLLAGVAILLPLAIDDARARITLLIVALGLAGVAVLNRRGLVTASGVVLVVVISGGILIANLASPIGLTMGELPNFDLYALSVVVAATVLPRASSFLVAAINSLLIVANFAFQPHNANITSDAALYSSATVQAISFLVRPIALQFVLAVIASLWVRGTSQAIRRADRAEEIATLEQLVIERSRAEADRTFALEEGVRYLQQTLAQWARGDIRHRVPEMPVVILERIRTDLNAFIAQLEGAPQADFTLRRVQEESTRLAAAVRGWRAGRPVTWPAPTGTPLDPVLIALIGTAPDQRGQPTDSRPSDGSESPYS